MTHAIAERVAGILNASKDPAAERLATWLQKKAESACGCGACPGWDDLSDLDSLLGVQ